MKTDHNLTALERARSYTGVKLQALQLYGH